MPAVQVSRTTVKQTAQAVAFKMSLQSTAVTASRAKGRGAPAPSTAQSKLNAPLMLAATVNAKRSGRARLTRILRKESRRPQCHRAETDE